MLGSPYSCCVHVYTTYPSRSQTSPFLVVEVPSEEVIVAVVARAILIRKVHLKSIVCFVSCRCTFPRPLTSLCPSTPYPSATAVVRQKYMTSNPTGHRLLCPPPLPWFKTIRPAKTSTNSSKTGSTPFVHPELACPVFLTGAVMPDALTLVIIHPG